MLWVGAHELKSAPDVPYRVVINEAVGLAKRFGATDSHKFVNAVLDAAARELRPMSTESITDGRFDAVRSGVVSA